MKRLLALIAASAILLTGCGEESSASGTKTVIPSVASMQSAMEQLGYKTTVIGDMEKDGYTLFSASNGEDLEHFDGVTVMQTVRPEDLEAKKPKTESVESEHTVFWAKTNDPELGNVFVTGTGDAIRKAGIILGD